MRKYIAIFSFFILSFVTLFVYAQTTDAVTAPENFPKTLNLNNQTWQLGNYQENKDLILAEYVLDNETVKNWAQLVTVQKFNFAINNDLTPEKFADLEIDELKKQNYDITFNKISSTPQEAIIEFRVKSPKDAQQDELQRIIITPEHKLIVLHYVIKKEDMGDEARAAWTKVLKDFKLDFLPKD